MAQLKAARAAEVPCNAAAPDMGGAQLDLASACVSGAGGEGLLVVGHRGKGMNARLRGDVRENTLRSFNDAARCPGVHYVEFDVQVTKDGCPVIFHDYLHLHPTRRRHLSETRDRPSPRRVTFLRPPEGPRQGGEAAAPEAQGGRAYRELGRAVRRRALHAARRVPGRRPPRRIQRRAQVRRRRGLHGGRARQNPASRSQGMHSATRLAYSAGLSLAQDSIMCSHDSAAGWCGFRWSLRMPTPGRSCSQASTPTLRCSCGNCRINTLSTS